MADYKGRIVALMDALNRQDFEAGLALLHPDVDWPDLMNGGRLRGPAAVRAYWGQVYAVVRSQTEVLDVHPDGGDRVAARMLHTIHDRKGKLWSEDVMTHVFTFSGELMLRMDAADGG